jgi:GntR family transcriptional repressor for pyruvate dehydrogenase complex
MVEAQRTVVPFQPPRRRRLHQDVAEQLRDAILDGLYAPGDKLPPERELAEEFQVNRTSVREAIKVLEGLGLVAVRQGDGATVLPLIDASLDVLPPMIFHGGRVDMTLLGELNEVMRPLLFEMGRLAIERSGTARLPELKALRDRIADGTLELDERANALRAVLIVLSDMTGNRVWQMLARRTHAFLSSEPLQAARGKLRPDPGRVVPAMDECIAALEAGRIPDAITALQRVIRTVEKNTMAHTRKDKTDRRKA